MGLYFVSDVVRAGLFEPLLRLLIAVGRMVPLVGRVARRRHAVCAAGRRGDPMHLDSERYKLLARTRAVPDGRACTRS